MPVPLLEKDRKNSQGLTEAGVCLKWGSVGRNDDLKYVCINFVTRLGEHTGGVGGGESTTLFGLYQYVALNRVLFSL